MLAADVLELELDDDEPPKRLVAPRNVDVVEELAAELPPELAPLDDAPDALLLLVVAGVDEPPEPPPRMPRNCGAVSAA